MATMHGAHSSIAALSCAFVACAATAHAQEDDQPPRWLFGVGGYVSQSPFLDADPEVGAFPYIGYEGEMISADVTGIAITPIGYGNVAAQILVSPRWNLTEPEDSPALEGMDRNMGLDVGVGLIAGLGPVGVSLEYLRDVTDESEGQEVTLSAGYEIGFNGGHSLGLATGAYWRDDNLGTYMYGVFDDEARIGRPAYSTGDSISPFFGASFTYVINSKWIAIAATETEFFPEEITDSPIVDKDSITSGFIGFIYDW